MYNGFNMQKGTIYLGEDYGSFKKKYMFVERFWCRLYSLDSLDFINV